MRNVLISLLLLTLLVGFQTAIVRQAKIKKWLRANFIEGIKSSKFIILVSILLIMGGGCMKKNSRDYSAMQNKGKVLIEYRLFGGEPPGIDNRLTIYDTGFFTYLLTGPTFFNHDEREHEAGYYEGQIDLNEINSFIKILQKDSEKITKRPFIPDEVIAEYKFIKQNKEISILVSLTEIPEEMWDKTRLIIQELMKKPVWTINLEAYNVGDEGSVDLKFTMKNRGRKSIQIANPWAKSKGKPYLTNFIIDGFPKEALGESDYFPDDVDNSIRWMSIERKGEQDKIKPFISLTPKDEVIIQYTPEKLIKFCKRKNCVIEGRYEGDVKVPGGEPLGVSIYSNMIEIGKH